MKQLYTKVCFSILLTLFFSLNLFSQTNKSLWTKTAKEKISKEHLLPRKNEPLKASYYTLDLTALTNRLELTPKRGESNAPSNTIISLPISENSFENFRVKEASIMHSELQNRYPNIRSYVGQSIENPETIIRFSITPQGLHALVLSSREGLKYIDPYTKNNNIYIIYSKSDLPILDSNFICYFEDDDSLEERMDLDFQSERNANDGMMRDFRLAIASTIEYSDYHVQAAGVGGGTLAEKKAAVLAAMVVTMTRVNGVFERDLSITMTLVANNDSIIYINTDTFDNDNAATLIGQSQTVIDNVIGSANYDIGHTFSTGGGGLATLNSPCVNGSKARGITGSPNPVGDAYDIDYVAHEMGHQYGAPHTFNGDAGNCAGSNRTASNAYEPGSGSTIMAYAGICPPQNVQPNSDSYFHQKSLQMIWSNVTTGSGTCSNQTSTGNSAPTAEAGASYLIPISTPFKLTGSSTDADGLNTHTYTWEQYDLGPAGVPTEATTTGPVFRSFEGTDNPTRFIPRLEDLLVVGGSTDWEKLPSIGRDLDFQLTVRDNDSNGGQTATDNMTATTIVSAGPFAVTSQTASQLVWSQGATETVTWDVAGTTGNGINTTNVNILLSTDGGLTYDTVLASNTPNDGSEDITVPSINAAYCRVMVEAVGNIYFSINTIDFAVGNYTYELQDVCEDYLFNANISIPESSTQYSGYLLTVNDSYTISDLNVNVNITHGEVSDLYYAIRAPFQTTEIIRMASGLCAGSIDVDLTFDDEAAGAVNCASTNNGDVVTPQDPLNVVDGEDSSGDWIFFVTDINVGDGNTAVWNTTTLNICRSELVPVLSVDEFSISETFSIYPNPNNGEFTIKTDTASNNITVEIYDIRGRSVFSNSYSNISANTFNQTIDLKGVQSGIYIVKLKDGVMESAKKIIIE